MIKVIYKDQNLIVIDKPAGIVVHPGAGEPGETLVDYFLSMYPEAKKLSWPDPTRPGIVHRLDKDTSGLMILAKNPETLEKLQTMMQDRQIKKSYLALVDGELDKREGEITGFIGRDPHHRRQQTSQAIHFDWQPGKKRESKTRYRVVKEYKYDDASLSLVEATLDTGRTHQIRVHFKSISHPVIGDQTYNTKHSRKISKELGLSRQFLHSYKLGFDKFQFASPLPAELDVILKKIC